jgi:hypothetical protein
MSETSASGAPTPADPATMTPEQARAEIQATRLNPGMERGSPEHHQFMQRWTALHEAAARQPAGADAAAPADPSLVLTEAAIGDVVNAYGAPGAFSDGAELAPADVAGARAGAEMLLSAMVGKVTRPEASTLLFHMQSGWREAAKAAAGGKPITVDTAMAELQRQHGAKAGEMIAQAKEAVRAIEAAGVPLYRMLEVTGAGNHPGTIATLAQLAPKLLGRRR